MLFFKRFIACLGVAHELYKSFEEGANNLLLWCWNDATPKYAFTTHLDK